jgi:hypothetical protein
MTVDAMPEDTSPISFRFSLLPYSRPGHEEKNMFGQELVVSVMINIFRDFRHFFVEKETIL